MQAFWAIYKKELRTYFASPIAYVVIAFYLLITGYFFYSNLAFFSLISFQAVQQPQLLNQLNVNEGVLRPLFENASIIALLVVPMLTMRLFAEEKRQGTIELLLSYPVRDIEVGLAKFASCLTVYALALAISAAQPVIVAAVSNPEISPILSGYLGMLLMGGAFIALGIFISSLTENQIVAVVSTFGTLLLIWAIGFADTFTGPTIGLILRHISIIEHFTMFAQGVIDTQHIVFYLNFIVFCLFLTMRSLESKRWRS